jgi:hypothetical protein
MNTPWMLTTMLQRLALAAAHGHQRGAQHCTGYPGSVCNRPTPFGKQKHQASAWPTLCHTPRYCGVALQEAAKAGKAGSCGASPALPQPESPALRPSHRLMPLPRPPMPRPRPRPPPMQAQLKSPARVVEKDTRKQKDTRNTEDIVLSRLRVSMHSGGATGKHAGNRLGNPKARLQVICCFFSLIRGPPTPSI